MAPLATGYTRSDTATIVFLDRAFASTLRPMAPPQSVYQVIGLRSAHPNLESQITQKRSAPCAASIHTHHSLTRCHKRSATLKALQPSVKPAPGHINLGHYSAQPVHACASACVSSCTAASIACRRRAHQACFTGLVTRCGRVSASLMRCSASRVTTRRWYLLARDSGSSAWDVRPCNCCSCYGAGRRDADRVSITGLIPATAPLVHLAPARTPAHPAAQAPARLPLPPMPRPLRPSNPQPVPT
mgnify:CR=1 FL=1